MRESSSDPTEDQVLRLRDRLRVISEVTRGFAEATTDYQRLLDGVASSLSRIIKDSCVVFVLDADGVSVRPMAIHADDPAALEQVRQIAAGPLRLAEHPTLQGIIDTGRAVLVPALDQQGPRSDTTPEQVAMQRKLGLHSFLLVALRSHGRSIGVLSLGRFRRDSPPYTEDDRELAQNLADHASLAIENARLYSAEQAARQAAERAERATRDSEGRLRRTLDNMMEGYTILGYDLRYLYVNDTGARQARLKREDQLGRTPMELFPDFEKTGMYALLQRCLKERAPVHAEEELTHVDGSKAYFEVNVQPTPEGLVVLSVDTTERRRAATAREALEEQLRQAQKMEAVGRLAGGVAHDFNNLLAVILGYGETLLADVPPGDPMRADLEEIQKAGQRGAELTKQLLMFSRQQVMEPKVLDLNAILTGIERMLRRILGEHLVLTLALEPSLGRIRADRGNIEQVLMNLVVNARDAMPRGGTLTIETANVVLDDGFARAHLGTDPGPYVLLAVTDTGVGMDKATRLRIFEPFFTTKKQGEGTGLGLSTVFGIAQQSGGGVWVYSEPGHGSTFKVYLPRVEAELETRIPVAAPATLRGSETILLVEDDEPVRVVTKRILQRLGYDVVVVDTPSKALLLGETHPKRIHLLLTDVMMPQMSGVELASRFLALFPDAKVLYVSGYTDGSIASHGVLDSAAAFLQKPFTLEQMAQKVRSVLDA